MAIRRMSLWMLALSLACLVALVAHTGCDDSTHYYTTGPDSTWTVPARICTTFTVTHLFREIDGPCYSAVTLRLCADPHGIEYDILSVGGRCEPCGRLRTAIGRCLEEPPGQIADCLRDALIVGSGVFDLTAPGSKRELDPKPSIIVEPPGEDKKPLPEPREPPKQLPSQDPEEQWEPDHDPDTEQLEPI